MSEKEIFTDKNGEQWEDAESGAISPDASGAWLHINDYSLGERAFRLLRKLPKNTSTPVTPEKNTTIEADGDEWQYTPGVEWICDDGGQQYMPVKRVRKANPMPKLRVGDAIEFVPDGRGLFDRLPVIQLDPLSVDVADEYGNIYRIAEGEIIGIWRGGSRLWRKEDR